VKSSLFHSYVPTRANRPGKTRKHLVQRLLKHSLRIVPLALRHVAGCLSVKQEEGGGAFVCHLLEDVIGILQLLTALQREETNTHSFITRC